MARIAADLTWLIGGTPLVALERLSPPGCRILGKLEAWNPSRSNKDRAALAMIRHAERSGFLGPGGTIVECSSGDLGIAIAAVGCRSGYRVVLTMPEGVAEGRRRLLIGLGAEIVQTPAAAGMGGAMAQAEQLARQIPGAVCLQAFTNRANARAHAETTAREIWQDTDGAVGLVVVPVGTGGTAAGCATYFREHGVPVAAVQPRTSAVLTGGEAGYHDIPGIGPGFVPDILNPGELAEIIAVGDDEAVATTRRLLREECLLVGPASGAVTWAAIELATRPRYAGQVVVAVLPDSAERCLDHQALAATPEAMAP